MEKVESLSAGMPGYDTEKDFNLLIRRILSLGSLAVNARLREIGGPTEAQWRPLHYLRLRSPLRVIELARFCEVDAAGMTRLIDRLERKGLCRRQRSPSDRRVVEVFLTERGTASAEQIAPILDQVQVELIAGFSPEQRADLHQLLVRLANSARPRSASSKQE